MSSKGVMSLVGLASESRSCSRCGSTSRIERGLCVNCLLYRGLGEETFDGETLEQILDEIDVRDADWRLGNYQILEEIGRGGMGVIYRARQRHSRRIVALKRILAHHTDSHDTLIRFRREAEAAASLDHQHILPIYEVSESEDGFPFFSMKFAAGGSLLRSQSGPSENPRQAVTLMAKVSRAVEYAHGRGILHRDLKPGNILLDGRGEPMVSDFGLAKWLDGSSDLTRTLTIFGTPGYIAPEQAHGRPADLKPTADVYSLGAMLFDLLAGRPPFLGEHALSVIEQAKEKPAPRLRSIVPQIDRDLETICARCLERDPNVRYRSAGDLASDLERWTEGRPVIARPVPPPVRIWRWAKRNPKFAASVAGCALAGVIALTFVTFTFLPNTSPFHPLLAISEKSIAVLPFENLSDDKQNSYFADGVQDEILTNLAKIADLKVISRTSVMQYKSGTARNLREIARALGVAKVVEGSVQRVGDRVKISAQLIDARRDTHLWGTTFDRSLADVFAVQSEVAVTIAGQLKAKLSSAEEAAIKQKPTDDLVAYDRFARAKSLIESTVYSGRERESLLEASHLLEEAVARDRTFLRAFCQLARVHDKIYILGLDHTPARLAMADEAIKKASLINPDAGEAHLARANHFYVYLNYDAARQELALAATLLPNEPLCFELAGFMDRRAGNWEGAVRQLSKALELDPRNLYLLQQLSLTYEHMRRFPDMAKTMQRAIQVAPDDVNNHLALGILDLEWRADPKTLHRAVEQAIGQDPGLISEIAETWVYLALCERDWTAAQRIIAAVNRDACRIENVKFPRTWCDGILARAEGDTTRARSFFLAARAESKKIVQEQPNFGEALSVLGMIEAALGEKEKAVAHGKRAVELVPVSRDAINGPLLVEYLSIIYSWVGQKDQAIEELKRAAATPSTISYGALRLHPYWDELRGDPRFEEVVRSLAPR